MNGPKGNLDGLRREIDEIDTAVHDLIMRRAAIVEQIADAKGEQTSSGMRPGREAEILRRLVARHDGPFPRGSLVRIWREIIASLTAMQGPYSIAVYASGRDQGYWDLARDHFGSHTRITAYATRRDVLTQVFEGAATHGVLPFPSEHDDPPWWGRLYGPEAPRIVLRLPFADLGNVRGEEPEALVIARIEPEPTGDDRTLLVVETTEPLGRRALDEMLGKAKMVGQSVGSHSKDLHLHLHLVEVEGFLGEDDVGPQMLAARDKVERVMLVGAYPSPLPVMEPAAPFSQKEKRK